ncbi:hypothetical protein SSX86_011581 [Deinandra increscens subsp. villosa]|uniref:Uncharacterized protein n=1 Tax=Deinandra increscens subsp. villosa TaxID=3103831 RepID=A0AAP0DBV9_9ASTR
MALTKTPKIISTLSDDTNGHRSFFSHSFPLPSSDPTTTTPPPQTPTSSSPSSPATELISAVDIHYRNNPIFTKTEGLPVEVKRLQWKFRGNYTILVDGLPVEVYWDVYSWFFGKLMGNAVFLFQTCLFAEKLWGSGQPVMSWSGSLVKDCGLGFSLVLFAWRE